jgi:hypothetical protein
LNKHVKNIKNITNNNNNNKLAKDIQDFMPAYKVKELTDQELNNLNYEIAIIFDKRTYFQYYFSLLKKKQLLREALNSL